MGLAAAVEISLEQLPEQVRRAEKVSALDIAIGVAIAAVLVSVIPVLCD
jgi:hypothetical protein